MEVIFTRLEIFITEIRLQFSRAHNNPSFNLINAEKFLIDPFYFQLPQNNVWACLLISAQANNKSLLTFCWTYFWNLTTSDDIPLHYAVLGLYELLSELGLEQWGNKNGTAIVDFVREGMGLYSSICEEDDSGSIIDFDDISFYKGNSEA